MAVYSIHVQDSIPDGLCHVHEDCQLCPEIGRACWLQSHPHAYQREEKKGNLRVIAECRVASTKYDYETRTDVPHVYTMSLTVQWEGCVVDTGVHQDRQVMSDVWDNCPYVIVRTGPGQYEEISTYKGPGVFAAESAASYAFEGVQRLDRIDAPAEHIAEYRDVGARYRAHVAEETAKRVAAQHASEEARRVKVEEEARKAPAKGKTVKVVRGRKVPVGTTGECIWIGDGSYGRRVGIKDSAGKVHWTAATNVEAVSE